MPFLSKYNIRAEFFFLAESPDFKVLYQVFIAENNFWVSLGKRSSYLYMKEKDSLSRASYSLLLQGTFLYASSIGYDAVIPDTEKHPNPLLCLVPKLYLAKNRQMIDAMRSSIS